MNKDKVEGKIKKNDKKVEDLTEEDLKIKD